MFALVMVLFAGAGLLKIVNGPILLDKPVAGLRGVLGVSINQSGLLN